MNASTRKGALGIFVAISMLCSLALLSSPARATFPGTNSSLYMLEYGDSGSGGVPKYNADGSYSGDSARCGDAGPGLTLNTQSRIWAGDSYYGPGTFISCLQSSGESSIYFIPSDFSNSVEVTFMDGSHKDPAISEDGNRMLYSSAPSPTGEYSICELMLDDGGSAQPTCFDGGENGDDWAPVWNPSDPGQFLFVTNTDGDADIWMYDFGAEQAGPLTENDVNDFGPDYAPDGSRIVYSSQVNGLDQLFWMTQAEREPNQITTDANNNYEPAVSPDGNQLAFVKQGTAAGSRSRIYLMPFDTGEAVPIEDQLDTMSYDHPEWFQAGGGGGCEPNCEPPTEDRGFGSFKLVKHLKAKGWISSEPMDAPECKNNQSVKIQRRKSGRWITIKTGRTMTDGFFVIRLPDKPGKYRAKLGRVEAGDEEFPVICGAATSAAKRHTH